VEAGGGHKEVDTAAASRRTKVASRPRSRLLSSCLSFFGLASLSYLLGAAVVFFDLPTSTFLRRAFVGGATWYQLKHTAPPAKEERPTVSVGRIDKPDKTFDGFTLCLFGLNCRAVLVNMRGEMVHEWHKPFSSIWPDPPHLRGPIDDDGVSFYGGQAYPNGDLLVVMEGPPDIKNPAVGFGLAKLDKDSHILWSYPANCHHDLDIGEDGTIYALSSAMLHRLPEGAPKYIPTPCMVDFVEIISLDGKRLKRISLLDAFKDSPYAALLCPLLRPRFGGIPPPGTARSAVLDDLLRRDVFHANTVKVLSRKLAPKFPMFKAGQLLISARHMHTIAVLDPDSEKVVWAARGPWGAQHDPTFLDNGHLLIFDNLGSPWTSRVLEYDPRTQALPWSYPDENDTPFSCLLRGACQRLPNGNTLIVNTNAGEMFEVTAHHEVVWSCSSGAELWHARRYTADQLPFLEGKARARP
jgi:hypothetical protein